MVKIILAIDGSSHSDRAWQFYYDVIRRPDDELLLVHALEIPYQPTYYLRKEQVADLLEKCKKDAQPIEEKYTKLATEKGINHRLVSDFSQPGEYVVKVAAEEKATLIIIGTRGQGKTRRTILGSVSDYAVHHAPCPVAVIRK